MCKGASLNITIRVIDLTRNVVLDKSTLSLLMSWSEDGERSGKH